VTVLRNQAVRKGPLAIGGIDDAWTGHADARRTLAAVHGLRGAPLLLTHSPDVFADLLPGTPTMLAAHTHCGQGVLPFYGPVTTVSHFHNRYRCGLVMDPGLAVIVTGGLGTSGPPLRFGAPPDLWLITLEG